MKTRDALDASRWRKVRSLSRREPEEMSLAARLAWDRLIRGGWYTADLEKLLDALPDEQVKP